MDTLQSDNEYKLRWKNFSLERNRRYHLEDTIPIAETKPSNMVLQFNSIRSQDVKVRLQDSLEERIATHRPARHQCVVI